MGNKKTKETENNLPTAVDQKLASDLVQSVCAEKGGSRQVEFMLYVLSGKSISDSAKATGYALNHGYRLMKKYRHDAKFRQEVSEVSSFFPEWYISVTKLKSPRLADLDNRMLDKYEENVELAIRHPQALKQIKQTAGLLPSDAPQIIKDVVNIENLTQVQNFVRNVLSPPEDIIEAEQIEGE